ncbi:MAG: DUF58 domain-containing protein [candidate division WS1 bacterium]|nr:DUF58 domain-containing protein [candidate division WS1 bacterium]
MRYIPTPRLGIVIAAAGLLCGPLVAVGFAAWLPWVVVGLVLGAALLDTLWMVPGAALTARRELPARLGVGARNRVRVVVSNASDRPVEVKVRDEVPLRLQPQPEVVSTVVAAGVEASVEYAVYPRSRGAVDLGWICLRWRGPLGLMLAQRRIEPAVDARTARVYPSYVDYGRFVLESRIKLRREGPQRMRIAQRADEFESLREYVPGDDARRVDWKATARRRRLIARNYEEERSKDILILIDAGRMMAPEANGLTKLDRAINAALMIATVAAERKDRVGLFVFADEPLVFIPPAHGKAQISRFMDALYDVQVRLVEPDFPRAFGYLKSKHRKRGMIIMFTDLIDSEASAQLIGHVSAITRQHLPLFISIRDQSLEEASAAPIDQVRDVYRRAVAEQVIYDRDVALAQLRNRGATVMDVAPDRLTVEAVNRYILLRRTGQV